jgi:hypothetical protein
MTEAANKAFADLLAGLEIDVTVDDEGLYTVCTQSEPFFCYDGHDKSDVIRQAVQTLESYGRLFE